MDQENIFRIESISQFFEATNWEKPSHPLIGVMDVAKFKNVDPDQYKGMKMVMDMYSIMLKDGNCGMMYGRNKFDFQEGVLQFTAPNQIISATESYVPSTYGFILLFHPDLIRNFDLSNQISKYNFFNYDVHEALHLSKKEESILIEIVSNIQSELDMNIDKHSQEVLVTNLQLLLSYANRFYERQFITRTHSHSDIISEVEKHIKEYFRQNKQLDSGTPTPDLIAQEVSFSTNYLSDMLKKETGKSIKDHIDDFTIELAKTQLVTSNQTVNEIAYQLGFNYPHYFSRMFKKKTGQTPSAYRSHFLA